MLLVGAAKAPTSCCRTGLCVARGQLSCCVPACGWWGLVLGPRPACYCFAGTACVDSLFAMAAGKSGLSSSSLLLASVPPLLACMLLALPWDWTGVVRYGADAIVRDDTLPPGAHQSLATDAYTRTTQHFSSHGEQLEGWLYVPSNKEHSSPRPCVIMAHGLGGQKDFGLHRFGERFVQEGFTTLVFDYRCFGGSSGEPRNWISPRRHVEDWMSAVKALQASGTGRARLAEQVGALLVESRNHSPRQHKRRYAHPYAASLPTPRCPHSTCCPRTFPSCSLAVSCPVGKALSALRSCCGARPSRAAMS